VNLGARLLKAVPPGRIAASAEIVAALGNEAPALGRQFRLVERAFEIPGAEGVTVAVYAVDEPSRVMA
jgi:class 3 adenylate cyclase